MTQLNDEHFELHDQNKAERYERMKNKERANKIKKLLGLRGNDNEKEYYRVADVICDLILSICSSVNSYSF